MLDRRAEVAAELARLRRERGVDLRAVAAETGLSWQYVSRIERGETPPSARALDALARVFGVDGLTRDVWHYLMGAIPPDMAAADIPTARRALGAFRQALARNSE